ncbi:formin-like protein 3 isoform X2 [Myripristis murdjan]|uniref:formin-like protein 3 isoform X2 n=1 Tax=Myripristis murdjan TaxID=586833 RepID=UPI001175FC86|nr:formin-like protein 3 isoform X2 [Myripristis murdjan]
MAAAPPPPPPLPPQKVSLTPRRCDPPVPQHAAMPYFFDEDHPVQETSPALGAQNGIQAAADPQAQPQTTSPPPLLPGQAGGPSGPEDKKCPVQETDPAPQAQNGSQLQGAAGAAGQRADMTVNTLMDQAGED